MPPTKPTSKRTHRQASVVFADVVGFTSLSERVGPESLAEVMESCFGEFERIIGANGGTVDKYIGDCVMALFGAEEALEDSAAHAARASLEMRTAIRELAERSQEHQELDVHIGINTGPLVAGEMGGEKRRDFTVLGDTVNIASRLEDKAGAGVILVGPETWAVTQDRFDYQTVGPLALKGRSEPLATYELLGLREGQQEAATLGSSTRKADTQFVGRRESTAQIESSLIRLSEGSGGLLLLRGDAGMGKSRLLLEITDNPALEGTRVLVGRSDDVRREASGYQPFREKFRALADIGSNPGPEDLEKLRRVLHDFTPETADDNLPLLALLLDIPVPKEISARTEELSGEPRRVLLQKAIADLLSGLARQSPVLVCFEDFHWADPSTVQLLEALLWIPRDLPVSFLLVSRLGFEDTTERLAATAALQPDLDLTEVSLKPLTQAESRNLARHLLGVDTVPLELHELITVRAGGNPYHVEEIVRSLHEHPDVEIREGRFLDGFNADALDVPGSVREIITARVDRLDDNARQLLEIMSVVGHRVPYDVLAALCPGDVDLDAMIHALAERELIQRADTGDGDLIFQHALAHDAVYNSLLERTRAELHGRVADTIEEQYGDRIDEVRSMLALHHLRAGRTAEAEPHLLAAGEAAIRSAASGEALSYFREAYQIHPELHGEGGDPELRARLEEQIALAHLAVGDTEGARPFFDRALENLGERRPWKTTGQARRYMVRDLTTIFLRGFLLGGRARRPATDALRRRFYLHLERARAQSVTDPDRFLYDTLRLTALITRVDPRTVDQAFALYAGAALLFAYSGLSFRISHRFADIAKGLLREDNDEDLLTYHLMLFMSNYFEGEWDEPCGIDDRLIDSTLKAGRLWDLDTYVGMAGLKARDRGDYDEARRWGALARQLLDVYGYRFASTTVESGDLLLALEERRLDDALQAAERYLRHPVSNLNLVGRGVQAKIYVLRGELDKARAALDQCEALVLEAGGSTPFHRQNYVIANAAYHAALLAKAEEDERAELAKPARKAAAMAIAGGQRMAPIRVEAHRLAGEIEFLAGKPKVAGEHWENALAEARRLGMRPELARTHLLASQRMRDGSLTTLDGLSADEHRETARGLFEQLGRPSEFANAPAPDANP